MRIISFFERHPKFYYIFLPITYIIDYLMLRKYWKFVLKEMIETEEIFDWLNKNDFGYRKLYFVKKDVIEAGSFYDSKNSLELKSYIKKEMTKNILDLFDEYLTSDIENYINVYIDVDFQKDVKIYSIFLRYYRYQIIKDNFKYFAWYLSAILIILTSIYIYK